ncbi:MAG TPA: ATP synthase F1 subunit delta [Bacteroidales bacterium]|nr:ATP synthase F1 subunit delta [Bacteroidales bacterium]
MNDSKISIRYSRALFESATEKKQLDKVYDDMVFIAGLCKIDEVREVLESPIIVPSKKKNILFSVLEKNVQPLTLSLVDLLIKNGREDYLPAVARVFRDETLKFKGVTEASLVTAVPVSDSVRKQISTMIESVFKTKAELKESTDTGIIGGFVLRINDNYIDASVRTKLRRVRKGLSVRAAGNE